MNPKEAKITAAYRAAQFEKVTTPYSEFGPKIKIIKPDGETNWFNITEIELQQLRELLTTICAHCGEKMHTIIRAHHHTEDGEDVTI